MNNYSIDHSQSGDGSEQRSAEELKKANEIIGQFITSCSHSLRGPIKSIEGLVNLLRTTSYDDSNAFMFLEMIAKVIDKMEHQLDEMEHFLENTNRGVVITKVDFRSILEAIVRQNRREIDGNKLNVSIEICEKAPFHADRHRIALVLKSLLVNAIQFRDDHKTLKQIRIHVNITQANCHIEIVDNGIGIPEECLKKIFQMFFRASEKSTGTGIGLYVVNEVLSKMGGTIDVTSEPGKGSTFTLSIPNSTL
jgi:signal transduction histidine kinase